MRAAVWRGPNRLELEDRLVPEPADNEVQIKVNSVGVCGTDLHVYQGYSIGTFIPAPPLILGHEVSGTISKLGKCVTDLQLDERVVVEPNIGCGKCYLCQMGSYHQCRQVKVISIHRDGAFAEYMVAPREKVYSIPDNLSFEEAALIEVLAIPVSGVKGRINPADTVVILGPGAGGLCFVQLARVMGAKKIILTGTRKERLKAGEKTGADVVINVREEDPVNRIMEETNGEGAEVVIEAAGVGDTFHQAIEIAKPLGKIIIYGIPVKAVDGIDFGKFILNNLTMVNAAGIPDGYRRAIDLASSRQIDLKSLITHEFNLEEIKEAFNVVKNREGGVIRALIKP